MITALVVLAYSYRESERLQLGRCWPFLLATLLVGPTFALAFSFTYAKDRRELLNDDRE